MELIRRGEVRVLPAVTGLGPGEVALADGSRVPADLVVLATGYRPDLESLLDPEILASRDFPPEGRHPDLPGLWFCGFAPELLRIRRSARRIARGIARDLRAEGLAPLEK